MGVRSRIFIYFLLFTALLLVILWLFQIVFLEDFYRFQKMDDMRSSSESLAQNIDNENLQTLAYRISEQMHLCISITDEKMRTLVDAEAWNGCIVHRLHPREKHRMANTAYEAERSASFFEFPLKGFRNIEYDERQFRGHVPPSDLGRASSLMLVQAAQKANGERVYIFLNTIVTPVDATIQTISNELYFISAIMVILSFLLSLFLSRHITRPLVETTAAAASLSQGEYHPVTKVGYREIAQLNHQLLQAAEDLRQVERLQHELIANISHDLRTPLTLIEGYAEAVRDLPDEATPENMQVIIDEARRLNTLVNAILDLNTARNASGELSLVRYNLTESIQRIMTRYQKLIQQDGYRIVFEPSQSVMVMADEKKVEQVIYNLINNALTYTGSDRTVIVEQRVADEVVHIAVRDSGDGISPDEIPYIWDRYYRGGKPHKRAAIGSGLGLHIVKEILNAHHIRYGVESAKGMGSTFWFELPLSNKANKKEA